MMTGIERFLTSSIAKLVVDQWQLRKIVRLFAGKNGIEIGGTTSLFSAKLPIYRVINNLDGCNFSGNTIWEGTISEGYNYNFYKGKVGFQYICEANDLKDIETDKYDFLLASHCLEHCANPLKAIREWLRVIKRGGIILMILPDKRFTFDHKRPITSFQHILNDFENGTDERDLTHLDEILALHDLAKDRGVGNLENFRQHSLNNYENRRLHHHVFDFNLLTEIFSFLSINVISKTFMKPYHQIIVGRKV